METDFRHAISDTARTVLAKAREDLAKARKAFDKAYVDAVKLKIFDIRIERMREALVKTDIDLYEYDLSISENGVTNAFYRILRNLYKEDIDEDIVNEYYDIFSFNGLLQELGYTTIRHSKSYQVMRKDFNDGYFLLVADKTGYGLPVTLEDTSFSLYKDGGQSSELKSWNTYGDLASNSALRKILNTDAPELASLAKVSILKLIDTIEDEAIEFIRVVNATRFVGSKE